MRLLTAAVVLVACAGLANAQPALAIRFSNGTNQITVSPGTAVPLSVFATGLPTPGTAIPWTTPPGTGQPGNYAGFLSVLMDLQGSGGTPSSPAIAPPFVPPPFGNPGTISGSNVVGIDIGVGFNAPVTSSTFLLWSATYTVSDTDVSLNTLIRPTMNPPGTGLHVGLTGIITLLVSQYLPTTNGTAVIHVPAPPGIALVGIAGLVSSRRRR